ncbi:MAG: hypothetical protein AB7P99_08145 [Vicinamibacterales bacterium]
MRQRLIAVAALVVFAAAGADAQRRGGAATRTEPAQIECQAPLGVGIESKRAYCDVLTGRNQEEGIQVIIPPHTGTVTLRFDLHNRHLYSEELVKSGRGYRQYTARIGVLDDGNTLLSRFLIRTEFRSNADLVERVAADTGTGVKAVAPTGIESLTLTLAANVDRVSILGENLTVVRPDSEIPDSFTAPGRPIAVVSNITLEYRPGPARRR